MTNSLSEGRPEVGGFVFDLDGTLIDSRLDFCLIRRDIGVPEGVGVLEYLNQLSGPEAQRARNTLHKHEQRGAEIATLMPGAGQLLDLLQQRGVAVAILTRNSRAAAETACRRVGLNPPQLITREDAAPKPDPAGILLACQRWGLKPEAVGMVGDFHYDIDAGRNAGCRTILYLGGRDPQSLPFAKRADLLLECFTRPQPLLDWLADQPQAF